MAKRSASLSSWGCDPRGRETNRSRASIPEVLLRKPGLSSHVTNPLMPHDGGSLSKLNTDVSNRRFWSPLGLILFMWFCRAFIRVILFPIFPGRGYARTFVKWSALLCVCARPSSVVWEVLCGSYIFVYKKTFSGNSGWYLLRLRSARCWKVYDLCR